MRVLGWEWVSRYHRSWGSQDTGHHLQESSLLAGDLLLPSRDQVIEGDTSDAGSGVRVVKRFQSWMGWQRGSHLPGLVIRVCFSQGEVGLPHCRGKT